MRRCIIVSIVLITTACGGSSPTSPEPEPIKQVQQLSVPSHFRGVWAEPDEALARTSRYQANLVILQIDSWGSDLGPLAEQLQSRGIGTMVYVEQVFQAPRSTWDAGWQRVETWVKPLKDAGILWGFHVMDEPALNGRTGIRDEANAYVRQRGYDVFATEWIDYVSDQGTWKSPRPAGVRWYGVTCYDYGTPRTKWHIQNCSEEYARHLDWDVVIGQAFNAGNGIPDQAKWEAIAANRSIVWWVD